MRLIAREVMMLTEEELWQLQPGDYVVAFDDGEITVNYKKILFSWNYWLLHRTFPETPLLTTHCLTGKYDSDTHFDLGKVICTHILDSLVDKSHRWRLARTFYIVTNNIYNLTCSRLSEYVTTSSLHDLCDVLQHPEIVAAKEKYTKDVKDVVKDFSVTEKLISEVHDVVSHVLYKDEHTLPGNGIKEMCEVDILSKGQLLQLIGPRGYVHDIDGGVFRYPIHVGYGEGLDKLYDYIIESRSASRALINNTDPLEQSEYFNREIQLLCSVIRSVEGDCCTNFIPLPYYVEEGDLDFLKGKYYMDGDIPVMIWDTIDDLVGEMINIRSLSGCGNHDTQTVCRTCLGYSSELIPEGTNVGYALSTSLCAIISQLILSTKHYEASKSAVKLELASNSIPWLKMFVKEPSKIYLTKAMGKRNPIIRIDNKYVSQLTNILNVDVKDLAVSRITCCNEIHIVDTKANGDHAGPMTTINLAVSGTGSSLTTELLTYLKKEGWTSTSKYIEFQLIDWDCKEPIFNVPYKGDNVQLFLQEIKNFMMPNISSIIKVTDYKSRGAAITELSQLIRKRLKINMVQSEIFVRACMCVSPDQGNYNLPRTNENFVFNCAKRTIMFRSLTGMMAYQEQFGLFIDPRWYTSKERPMHMLDSILKHK